MNSQFDVSAGTDKAPTGIDGIDRIMSGGLPRGRTTLVAGQAGAGKTILALQTLVNGARFESEPGIFVAFEEDPLRLTSNAASFGWDLPSLEPDRLFFVDARVSPDTVHGGQFEITPMLAALGARAREMGAKRIVFDSIDALLALLDDPGAERRELRRLNDWLGESGLTAIVTAKASGNATDELMRYGEMDFMVDCALRLGRRLEGRTSHRSFRVLKYRGSAFAENEFPLTIAETGVDVAATDLSELEFEASTERLSSGVERLDAMLGGGYYRRASVLVTGSPGTAKTTLAGAFVDAACQRGERALYVSFDEVASEIVRNLASVGIRLQPHVEAGLLHVRSRRSESKSAEEHLVALRTLIRKYEPSVLVIDPLSALQKAGADVEVSSVVGRLLTMTKSFGMTMLGTSLLERSDRQIEATSLNVSTIADTWIHLSYLIRAGERNRALTIVKSRGTWHSNQVREMILGEDGITLADVYTAEGEVLMGTARWEKEIAERQEEAQRRADIERRRRELAVAEAEVRGRIDALLRELDAKRADLALLAEEQQARANDSASRARMVRRYRAADDTSDESPGPVEDRA